MTCIIIACETKVAISRHVCSRYNNKSDLHALAAGPHPSAAAEVAAVGVAGPAVGVLAEAVRRGSEACSMEEPSAASRDDVEQRTSQTEAVRTFLGAFQ